MDGTQGSNYSSHPMVPLETVRSNGRRGDPNPSESPVPGPSPSTAPVSCDVLAASPYPHPARVWRAGAARSLLALSSPLAPRQQCCGHTPVSGCIWLPRFRTYCRSSVWEVIPGDTRAARRSPIEGALLSPVWATGAWFCWGPPRDGGECPFAVPWAWGREHQMPRHPWGAAWGVGGSSSGFL